MSTNMHETQPVATAGVPLTDASLAVILLHGRGATSQSILQLAGELPQQGVSYLAPQAANRVWWPNSGFAPLEVNEPFITSALQTVSGLVNRITASGIPPAHIVIGGFSQGACLAAEYVAQHAQRYGGLFVLSGALLGPLDRQYNYTGSLENTPVFIGGVEQDVWVRRQQFDQTGAVLEALGGQVIMDIQPGNEHTVRPAEIEQVKAQLAGVLA